MTPENRDALLNAIYGAIGVASIVALKFFYSSTKIIYRKHWGEPTENVGDAKLERQLTFLLTRLNSQPNNAEIQSGRPVGDATAD
jgi:hypothetical protein